jgi:hypothetical protein
MPVVAELVAADESGDAPVEKAGFAGKRIIALTETAAAITEMAADIETGPVVARRRRRFGGSRRLAFECDQSQQERQEGEAGHGGQSSSRLEIGGFIAGLTLPRSGRNRMTPLFFLLQLIRICK